MMNKTPDSKIRRRAFLKSAAGAALGAVATQTLADTDDDPQPPTPPDDRGYRETEHVRRYYQSARF